MTDFDDGGGLDDDADDLDGLDPDDLDPELADLDDDLDVVLADDDLGDDDDVDPDLAGLDLDAVLAGGDEPDVDDDEDDDGDGPIDPADDDVEAVPPGRGDSTALVEDDEDLLDEVEDVPLTIERDLGVDDEVREGEFVCQSCFMAKRESALADESRQLCRDCV